MIIVFDDKNFDVYFIRDKKGGIEKKCETCGHTWWVSKNPEKQSDQRCYECTFGIHIEECPYCGMGNGCDGCSGPEEYDDDYNYQN